MIEKNRHRFFFKLPPLVLDLETTEVCKNIPAVNHCQASGNVYDNDTRLGTVLPGFHATTSI